jgi:hypothetical protein
VVAPAANHAPADSPAEESAVSTRRERGDSRTSCLDRQNTAERAQVPGNNGGCSQKVLALTSGPHPTPHREQSPLCPSTHGGWIGQACRIFAVRYCLFGRVTGADPLTGLLSTMQAVVPGRRQPIRQDREGLAARVTDSPPHPDACVPIVVALTESPAVTDDRVVTANGTSPRQQVQRDHPGSMLSFASGSAIKRITAGVKARR